MKSDLLVLEATGAAAAQQMLAGLMGADQKLQGSYGEGVAVLLEVQKWAGGRGGRGVEGDQAGEQGEEEQGSAAPGPRGAVAGGGGEGVGEGDLAKGQREQGQGSVAAAAAVAEGLGEGGGEAQGEGVMRVEAAAEAEAEGGGGEEQQQQQVVGGQLRVRALVTKRSELQLSVLQVRMLLRGDRVWVRCTLQLCASGLHEKLLLASPHSPA